MTTNYERIKNMSLDSLVKLANVIEDDCLIRVFSEDNNLDGFEFCNNTRIGEETCTECFKRWLKSDSKTKEKYLQNCILAYDNTETIKYGLAETLVITGEREFIIDIKNLKSQSLPLLFVNTHNNQSELIFQAGNAYPNSKLGDFTYPLKKGLNLVEICDISRFETDEQTIILKTNKDFIGYINCYLG